MSIVVSKNYQNKGIGSSLISKMMSYLELKIQTGIDISEILAETVSEGGEKIVSKFGFKKRGGFNNKAKLYSYSFKAYENGDLFLFAPCYLKNTIEKQQINSEFLSFLNKVTKNEFTSMPIKKEINRNFIGTFEFKVHEDYDINLNHFNIFGDLYLTTIHGFASIFIYFHNIQNDVCYLLDNASTGSLLIKINNDAYMFDEYLSTIGIVLTGRYRSFNIFNSMPTESYLTHILAMEQYNPCTFFTPFGQSRRRNASAFCLQNYAKKPGIKRASPRHGNALERPPRHSFSPSLRRRASRRAP